MCRKPFITHSGNVKIGKRILELITTESIIIEHFQYYHETFDVKQLRLNSFINNIEAIYNFYDYESLICTFDHIIRFQPRNNFFKVFY